ncbi:MAG: hypothetical protein U0X91_27470 [Spirosomataceae bacterium]
MKAIIGNITTIDNNRHGFVTKQVRMSGRYFRRWFIGAYKSLQVGKSQGLPGFGLLSLSSRDFPLHIAISVYFGTQ